MRAFRIFLVLIFLLFSCDSLFAQDDDDKNEEVPIEFNFADKKFSKILPFDQTFAINIINVPAEINVIRITIGSFQLDDWNRYDEDQTTALIVCKHKLKPNVKYAVTIEAIKSRNLTEAEYQNLKSFLVSDGSIYSIINTVAYKLIQKKIAAPNADVSNASLNTSQKDFNLSAMAAIKRYNVSMKIYKLNPIEQLTFMSDYTTNLKNLIDDLNGVSQSSPTKKESIARLIDKLNTINWGELNIDHARYKEINDSLEIIFLSITDPVILAKKNKIVSEIKAVISAKDSWIDKLCENVILPNVYIAETIVATYRSNFTKNAKLYVTLDQGIAYAARIDRVFAYTGANIYFRPIIKNIPLSEYKGCDFWKVRTSFLLGITLSSVEKDNQRKGLIDNKALVLGLGFKIVPFLKINAGGFMHYRYETNQLISKDRYHTSFSPFVSLSLDMDVKPLFTGIAESIFK